MTACFNLILSMKNKIKGYRNLFIGLFLALGILFIIYLNFKQTLPENFLKNGGFQRRENHIELSLNQKFKLNNDSYEFICDYNNSILLRSTKQNIIFIYSDNIALTNNVFIDLNKVILDTKDISSVEVDTSKNELHIFMPNSQRLLVVDMLNKQKKLIIKLPIGISKATMVNDTLVVVQNKTHTFKSILAMYSVNSSGELHLIKTSTKIFKSNDSMQDDGLIKPIQKGKIAYINFFMNRFYILDNTLNTTIEGRTIDTVSTPPKVSITEDGAIHSYAEPIRVVNDNFRSLGKFLLVRSMIASSNSEISTIRENAVIDVYNTQNDGKYIFSYFLNGIDRRSPDDFYFTKTKIFLVYPECLLVYAYKNNLD